MLHLIASIAAAISSQELVGGGSDYGEAVGIYEDRIFVGATGSNEVYVFTDEMRTGWSMHQIITVNTTTDNDEFGESIAVSADYLVIGARGAGSAYVFVESDTAPGNYTLLPFSFRASLIQNVAKVST